MSGKIPDDNWKIINIGTDKAYLQRCKKRAGIKSGPGEGLLPTWVRAWNISHNEKSTLDTFTLQLLLLLLSPKLISVDCVCFEYTEAKYELKILGISFILSVWRLL